MLFRRTNNRGFNVATMLSSALFFALASTVIAQDERSDAPREPERDVEDEIVEESVATKKATAEVSGFFSRCEFESKIADRWTVLPHREQPVMTFSDPTRFDHTGSVWVWGKTGRPAAVAEIYRKGDDADWILVGVNISCGKLRASYKSGPWWREHESTTKFEDIPSAPLPAATNTARQRQLKALARRFIAHEFWIPGNSRYELRLLERPLVTYQDEANGILDGALFTFANGTNPEIVLLVEAQAQSDKSKPPRFRFAVDRLTHAEIHVAFDEKEIYSAERGWVLCGPDKPYFSAEFSRLEAIPEE